MLTIDFVGEKIPALRELLELAWERMKDKDPRTGQTYVAFGLFVAMQKGKCTEVFDVALFWAEQSWKRGRYYDKSLNEIFDIIVKATCEINEKPVGIQSIIEIASDLGGIDQIDQVCSKIKLAMWGLDCYLNP